MCNQVQVELWGDDAGRYPPRTILEVVRLNGDDILEVEGTFYHPRGSGGEWRWVGWRVAFWLCCFGSCTWY